MKAKDKQWVEGNPYYYKCNKDVDTLAGKIMRGDLVEIVKREDKGTVRFLGVEGVNRQELSWDDITDVLDDNFVKPLPEEVDAFLFNIGDSEFHEHSERMFAILFVLFAIAFVGGVVLFFCLGG